MKPACARRSRRARDPSRGPLAAGNPCEAGVVLLDNEALHGERELAGLGHRLDQHDLLGGVQLAVGCGVEESLGVDARDVVEQLADARLGELPSPPAPFQESVV